MIIPRDLGSMVGNGLRVETPDGMLDTWYPGSEYGDGTHPLGAW